MRSTALAMITTLIASSALLGCSSTHTSAPSATTAGSVKSSPQTSAATSASTTTSTTDSSSAVKDIGHADTPKLSEKPLALPGIGTVTFVTEQGETPVSPRGWSILQNGVEKVKLTPEGGNYGMAEARAEDVNGDNKPEVIVNRYGMGSGGANALNIYSVEGDKWTELLAVTPYPPQASGRYEVRYIGNYKVRFTDKINDLQATITLDPNNYKGFQVPSIDQFLQKSIRDWVDPISEYKFADIDHDGVKEVLAQQRVIGVSHPDTIAVVQTTYKLRNDSYQPVSYQLLDGKQQTVLSEVQA